MGRGKCTCISELSHSIKLYLYFLKIKNFFLCIQQDIDGGETRKNSLTVPHASEHLINYLLKNVLLFRTITVVWLNLPQFCAKSPRVRFTGKKPKQYH